MTKKEMIFRQLFDYETYTYTYLLADPDTREAVLIDTVKERIDRDLKLVEELNLQLKYVLDTHVHADHITGAGLIREKIGTKTVLGKDSGAECADVYMADGDEIKFGNYTIKALSTPGHTNGCTSYYCDNKIFTGDALFARGTGRTDFQQGSSEKLYESIKNKLYTLPDDTFIYPGHDYKGHEVSTIVEEKKYNPRISAKTTKEEFVKIMSELKLADPKRIHEAVPANLVCGMK